MTRKINSVLFCTLPRPLRLDFHILQKRYISCFQPVIDNGDTVWEDLICLRYRSCLQAAYS